MLSRYLLRTTRVLPPFLPMTLRATVTTSKGLAQRKKKLYQSQVSEGTKVDLSLQKVEERRIREANFEKLLFDLAKEMMLVFSSRSVLQKKSNEIKSVLGKGLARIARDQKQINAKQLIHLSEMVKSMALMRLEHLQNIEAVYIELTNFMNKPEQQKELLELAEQPWDGQPVQVRVRAISIAQFLPQGEQQKYLAQATPLVRYFKSAEMLVLLYEKWRYDYKLSYEMLDQINQNQYYNGMEDVSQAYLKMLFVDSIRGQFGPNDDGIYSRVLNSVNDKPNILVHSAFSKLIKMLHSQNYFVQTQNSRLNLQFSLNTFINIAKNQNYEHSTLSLTQLVQIYLGFEESSSTGEILLSEITYYARVTDLKLTKNNFALFKQLLLSVIRNIQPKLKYERRDSLNKEYTNDSINFLREMVPKYLPLWPEVILNLNHAAHELFRPEDPLLTSFVTTYHQLLANHSKDISLANIPFLISVLLFLKAQEHKKGVFILPDEKYLAILEELEGRKNEVTKEQLEVLYLILSLLGSRIKEGPFRAVVQKVNNSLIEAKIGREMEKEKITSPINSLDQEIVWLSLCSALVKTQGFSIDESLLEVFINQKVFYLLNTLKYMEVVEMLQFVVGLSRLKPEVYERLLFGLSTFLLFISQRSNRSPSQFHLNHKYVSHYSRLCRLVLDNNSLFRTVPDKNSFRVLQVMYFRSIDEFSQEDTLKLLETLGDPAYLTTSMARILEDMKFASAQLQPYQNSPALKNFEYYNKSLLRFFQGKYNETEVRSRLRGDTLTRQQIIEYFSKNEVYQTIIMDGQLNIRFEMPQPDTNIPDFKFMYALQRIFQRTKQFNALDFKEDFPYSPIEQTKKQNKGKLIKFTDVDFSAEKNYIDREVLLPNTSANPFRIQSRTLPRYIKLQVWKSYVFINKDCQVDSRDLQPNHKKLTDEILNKVIKGGLYGSYEKIRQVLKQFSCSEELTAALKEAKIDFEQHGAAIEIKGEDKEKTLFTLLCTNNTSYKILYICAHFMTKHGSQVAVLKDSNKIETVVAFCKKHFAPKTEPEAEGKEEQNEIEQ